MDIIKSIKKAQQEFAGTSDGRRMMWEYIWLKFHLTQARPSALLKKEAMYQDEVDEKKMTYNKKAGINAANENVPRWMIRKLGAGIRNSGAGIKDPCMHIWDQLGKWLEAEFSYGHQMDRSDIINQWEEVVSMEERFAKLHCFCVFQCCG